MNIRYLLKITGLSFLLATLAAACIEPYDFKAAEAGDQLVVDGQFTTSEVAHEITLRRLSDFGAGPGEPVADATVTLRDDSGLAAVYVPTVPGTWNLPPEVRGVPGRRYWVEIRLDDGRLYESRPQEMPEVIRADSITFALAERETLNEFDIVVVENVIDIFIDTPLPQNGKTTYLRWAVEEAYSFTDLACGGLDLALSCYFTGLKTNPQRVVVFSNVGTTVGRVQQQAIATKAFPGRNLEFTGRHYFIVQQYNMASDTYRFWEQASETVDRTGSIFDTPPAAVSSNLYNPNDPSDEVLGLFEVSAVDTIRRFLASSDVQPFFGNMSYCPSSVSPGMPLNFPSECCFCAVLPGASLEKPHYWQ